MIESGTPFLPHDWTAWYGSGFPIPDILGLRCYRAEQTP